MGIGITLREYRKEHDLSQEELGTLCDPPLTGGAISLIESGERPDPRMSTLRKLSQAMGLTVDELIAASAQTEAATA